MWIMNDLVLTIVIEAIESGKPAPKHVWFMVPGGVISGDLVPQKDFLDRLEVKLKVYEHSIQSKEISGNARLVDAIIYRENYCLKVKNLIVHLDDVVAWGVGSPHYEELS